MFSIIATTYRGLPIGIPDEREHQIGPDLPRRPCGSTAFPPAGGSPAPASRSSTSLPEARGVVGVDELPEGAAGDFRGGEAQHLAQGPVDLQDRPVDLGDGDPDDRLGEHRLQPGLAVPPGLLGRDPGRERGRGDLLLLGAGAVLQALRVARRQLTQHFRQPAGAARPGGGTRR